MKRPSLPRSIGVVLVGALSVVSWVALPQPSARAAAFNTGNLVVYRVGDGTAALADAGAAVFLDEFTTTATPGNPPVQSIAMPTVDNGANKQLVANGTSNTEGMLARSADNRYLIVTGYDAAVGDADLNGQAATTVNRVVGRVDANGVIDTSTALTDFAGGGSPRTSTSTNGTDLWVGGSNGGVRYTTLGTTTSTQINTAGTNVRQLQVISDQLYASLSSAPIAAIGSGTPTTPGQTVVSFTGVTTAEVADPYGFFLADLSAAVAGLDTLYIADDTDNAIEKYSLVGGAWVSSGAFTIPVAGPAVRGLVGTVNAGKATLYGTITTQLYALVDANGYNQAFSGTYTPLANATTNTAFRGLAFAPSQQVTPTTTTTTTATDTTTATATTPTTTATATTPTTTATATTPTTTATTTTTTTATTTPTTRPVRARLPVILRSGGTR